MTPPHKASALQASLTYAKSHREDFEAKLHQFLQIKSISADSAYAGDIAKGAKFVARTLKDAGIDEVTIHPTSGHPIITGEALIDPALPTVLIYGHYDVQPVDPLHLWKSDPFSPILRGGRLYARGASDDKGQLSIHLNALKSLSASSARSTGTPRFPVNVKILIEGEEEIGSPSLAAFVKKHKRMLKSDILLLSDTEMLDAQTPALTSSLRGLVYLEVTLRTGKRDVHSGLYGGAALNAGSLLMEMLSMLSSSKSGRIQVEDFYRDVSPLSAQAKSEQRALSRNETEIKKDLGARVFRYEKASGGKHEQAFLLKTTAEPSLEVNGFSSGYTGEGAKTVIPALAQAKVSARLVNAQNPEHIDACLRRQLQANLQKILPYGWDSIGLTFKNLGQGDPVEIRRDSPIVKKALTALGDVYPNKPVLLRSGGSIPIVADLVSILGVEPILMGFGLKKDALHAANESFALRDFHRGTAASIRFLHSLAS